MYVNASRLLFNLIGISGLDDSGLVKARLPTHTCVFNSRITTTTLHDGNQQQQPFRKVSGHRHTTALPGLDAKLRPTACVEIRAKPAS